MNRRWLSPIGAAVAIAVLFVGFHPVRTSADTNCVYNFQSGSGESRFGWCLSSNGNVTRLESPAGEEHLNNGVLTKEGYAVCSDISAGHYHDYGYTSSGFSATTIISGCTSGSSCTLQRQTGDGFFRVKTAFMANAKEKELNISMTITNLTASPVNDIGVTRVADIRVNGEINSWGDHSKRSVWARQSFAPYTRVGLSAVTLTIPAFAVLVDPDDLNPFRGCDASPLPGPMQANIGFQAGYDIINLGSNKSKTVKFQYRQD
jgi:hypothetical protein